MERPDAYNLREKLQEEISWWEEAKLIEVFHHKRQAEFGSKRTGRPRKDEGRVGWGIRDTAKDLRLTLGSVAESLQLARAGRIDTSLRNIRDKKSAIQLVRLAAKLSKNGGR